MVKPRSQADSPVNAIVSVLMLREGWDVQNVTVSSGFARTPPRRTSFLSRRSAGDFG
jgi:hypothetical protein